MNERPDADNDRPLVQCAGGQSRGIERHHTKTKQPSSTLIANGKTYPLSSTPPPPPPPFASVINWMGGARVG